MELPTPTPIDVAARGTDAHANCRLVVDAHAMYDAERVFDDREVDPLSSRTTAATDDHHRGPLLKARLTMGPSTRTMTTVASSVTRTEDLLNS